MEPYTFEKEVCCVLANNKLLFLNKGTIGGVEFKFIPIWEYYKNNKFDELIMIHTHPSGCRDMSSTDENMINGWMKAFPDVYFKFIVICDNSAIMYDLKDGYMYEPYELSLKFINHYLMHNLIRWSCSNNDAYENTLASIYKNDHEIDLYEYVY